MTPHGDDGPAGEDPGRALSGTGSWLDDRFHGARGLRVFMRKVFPDHWSFMLGEIALWSFVILLLTAHLFIMVHQKHTQMPGLGNTEKNVRGQPFFPHFMAKGGAWFFFVFGALVLLATFAQINPVWLYGPYTPAREHAVAGPAAEARAAVESASPAQPAPGDSPADHSPST